MAEDLMNTQTGGEGQTIQLQDENQPTPEQFNVNIKPQQQAQKQQPQHNNMTHEFVFGLLTTHNLFLL